MTKFLHIAAAAAAIASASQVRAAMEPPSVRVSYADLDLHSEAGRAKLQGRLDEAVRRVCRKAYFGGLHETIERQYCIRETAANVRLLAAAVLARIDRERLAASALAGR